MLTSPTVALIRNGVFVYSFLNVSADQQLFSVSERLSKGGLKNRNPSLDNGS